MNKKVEIKKLQKRHHELMLENRGLSAEAHLTRLRILQLNPDTPQVKKK